MLVLDIHHVSIWHIVKRCKSSYLYEISMIGEIIQCNHVLGFTQHDVNISDRANPLLQLVTLYQAALTMINES